MYKMKMIVLCYYVDQYRTPNSRVFTTMYPQPLMLSPGNAFSLPVTFRPLENVVYEDSIEFTTSVSSAALFPSVK